MPTKHLKFVCGILHLGFVFIVLLWHSTFAPYSVWHKSQKSIGFVVIAKDGGSVLITINLANFLRHDDIDVVVPLDVLHLLSGPVRQSGQAHSMGDRLPGALFQVCQGAVGN